MKTKIEKSEKESKKHERRETPAKKRAEKIKERDMVKHAKDMGCKLDGC